MNIKQRDYSVSILKRQLERDYDVLLCCQMSHVYTISFLEYLYFCYKYFLNARNKEYIYKKYTYTAIE